MIRQKNKLPSLSPPPRPTPRHLSPLAPTKKKIPTNLPVKLDESSHRKWNERGFF